MLHILSSNQPSVLSGSSGCPIDPSLTLSPESGLSAMAAKPGQDNYFQFEITNSHDLMVNAQ